MYFDPTDCYGNYNYAPACHTCPYESSCRYYAATAPGIDRGLNLPSLDCVSDSCESLIDPAPGPGSEGEYSEKRETLFTLSDVAGVFRYLMELDDYTLKILREIIAPVSGRRCTISDLCRLHEVSKQSMHRKLFRVILRHPELRRLLRSTLERLPPRSNA